MYFMKNLLAITATLFTAIAVAAPTTQNVDTEAASYDLRCNGNNINIADLRALANGYRVGQNNDMWPCGQKNCRGVHGFHVGNSAYGSGYELECKGESYRGIDAADTVDEITDKCGSRGGSALIHNTEQCIIHVNDHWV